MNEDVKNVIQKSVLCWLATATEKGMPNVSPKEIFKLHNDNTILIANIASPQSIKNIKINPQVSLSMVDILVQKGYQLKGIAHIIDIQDAAFDQLKLGLEEMTQGMFPFNQIIKIEVKTIKAIVAPRYMIYPETSEDQQIMAAKKQYLLDS